MSRDDPGNGRTARKIGAAFLVSAVMSAGAAMAQDSSATTTPDNSAQIEQLLKKNREALEAERERRRASQDLSKDIAGGARASDAYQSYKDRMDALKKRRSSGTMFYQQQMDK